MRPHLSINVSNLSSSVSFYSKVFGLDPQKRSQTYAKFDLREPAFNFSMHEAVEGRQQSRVNHLGIEVQSSEEVGAWKKRLEEIDVPVRGEEGTDCCFALQDKVWFEDPDGNSWEIFFVHAQLPVSGSEPPKKANKSCSPGTGCC